MEEFRDIGVNFMIVTDITKMGDPQILVYEGKYYCYATTWPEPFLVRESEDPVH